MTDVRHSNYTHERSRIQTGDILLFSGTGPISQGIKKGSRSNWSHVAMAVRSENPDIVMVYQSTTLSKAKDLHYGEPRQGVQINLLSETVSIYPGQIAVRYLETLRTPEMMRQLESLRIELRGHPYEQDKCELFKALYDGPFGHNEEDLSSLFCSELVAEVYQRWGLISEDLSSNEFIPKDFSTEKPIELLKGATLSDEVFLKI